MRTKNRLAGMLMIGAMLGMAGQNQAKPQKQKVKKSLFELNTAKGLSEFFYGQDSVWALNQKSADKKAKKNNWI